MNIQTERLEDQTARVTVEVDAERLDAAKHKAAQQISRKVNIPGFRKGKVPYRVLLNYVGEPAILEDAVELLSQEVYRETLPETDLDPYGPGILTEVKSDEPTPTFVYVVPLQPDVDLAGYRDIRLPYAVTEINDQAVNRAMKNLQEQQAVVEDSTHPVVLGNRVTVDVHSFILEDHEEDEAEAHDEAEGESDSPAEAEDEHAHHHHEEEGTPYLHEHDLQLILDDDDEPTPGFNEALVGANVGDELEFELSVPDDAEEYQDAAGKTVKYYVTVKKVETLTLPELTDEFAARVTADEEKPLTLLELRMRVRENLETRSEENYRNEYVRQALDQIVEQANIKFPEAMVVDQVDRFLQDLDQRLRQQGITLQDYMKIYQKSPDDLYNDYRESAEQTVRRSLVLRTVAEVEGIDVTGADVDEQIEKIVSQFDEERQEMIRQMFTSQPNMREGVTNDLMRDRVLERITAIAKGEAPDLNAPAAADDAAENEQIEEAEASASTPESAEATTENTETEESA